MLRSLFIEGSIVTTEARAKAIRPMAEKLVTRAKEPTVANRRILISRMGGDERIVSKIVATAETFKERAGGYLRVVKMGPRKGDGSAMATIQFVDKA